MSLPFEIVIPGNPVSQQTRRRDRYNQWVLDIRDSARRRWPPNEDPYKGPVRVTVIYFHENRSMDVDNLAKPILDGLKGAVFVDDSQVTDLLCRKINLAQEFNISVQSRILLNALSNGGGFVHVLVERAPSQGVIV